METPGSIVETSEDYQGGVQSNTWRHMNDIWRAQPGLKQNAFALSVDSLAMSCERGEGDPHDLCGLRTRVGDDSAQDPGNPIHYTKL